MNTMRTRGFELLTESAKMPTKGTKRSAGFDFYLQEDICIPSGEILVVPTGVTAYMQDDEFLDIRLRSSIGRSGIILPNGSGVIDSDYYGRDIGFILLNLGKNPIHLKAGDRIGQGIFTKYLDADDTLYLSDDRSGGYGSTGN